MSKAVNVTKWLFLICAIFLLTSCGKVISNEEFDLRHGGPADEYEAIFVKGVKVGFERTDREVIDDRVHEKSASIMTFKIPTGDIQRMDSSRSIEMFDGTVLEYEDEDIKAVRKSSGNYDLLKLKSGKRSEVQWPADTPYDVLEIAKLSKGLAEGETFEVDVFSLKSQKCTKYKTVVGKKKQVEFVGKKEFLTELIVTSDDLDFAINLYVDDDCDIKKKIIAPDGVNLVYVDCDRDFAISKNGNIFDKLGVVKSPGPLTLLQKTYRIDYMLEPKSPFTPVSSDNQSFVVGKKGYVIVISQPVELKAGAAIPYTGDDPNALAALKPTDLLECDDELIVKLARKAVGKTKDAAKAAKRIEEFVLGHLSKGQLTEVQGYPSALQTVKARRGDCKGHAVLTAAMCRAVGIPARAVSGYRYTSSFAGHRHIFGAHAWTEAYIGGKWAGLDATRNTLWGLLKSYDAAYIAMRTFSNKDELHDGGSILDKFSIKKIRMYRKKVMRTVKDGK